MRQKKKKGRRLAWHLIFAWRRRQRRSVDICNNEHSAVGRELWMLSKKTQWMSAVCFLLWITITVGWPCVFRRHVSHRHVSLQRTTAAAKNKKIWTQRTCSKERRKNWHFQNERIRVLPHDNTATTETRNTVSTNWTSNWLTLSTCCPMTYPSPTAKVPYLTHFFYLHCCSKYIHKIVVLLVTEVVERWGHPSSRRHHPPHP